jgi:glycine hydroxymethyltransferase
VLKTARPFTLTTAKGALQFRAKVDFDALVNGAERISALCAKAGEDVTVPRDSYPHVWESIERLEIGDSRLNGHATQSAMTKLQALEISGEDARAFVHSAFTSDVASLLAEETQPSWLLERDGKAMSPAIVLCLGDRYRVAVPNDKLSRVARWLRALSDGYVIFDNNDPQAKLPGPVVVKQVSSDGFDAKQLPSEMNATNVMQAKPYFIGKIR